MLVNPNAAGAVDGARDVEARARVLGRRIRLNAASSARDLDEVFATLSQARAGALLIMGDAYFTDESRRLAALASGHAIPTIHTAREFAAAGGLMSYAIDQSDTVRLVGTYVGRILKGERPADLPVQQSARIELAVNLKAARALGVTVPADLLAGATEVFE